MGSLFGVLAIIILCVAVIATLAYLILKAASFFKRRFGVSLWPGVIALCLSIDIFTFSALSQHSMDNTTMIVLYIAAGLLLSYALYRDIKYYRAYSIPAFLLQLLLAITQIIILVFVIVVKLAKNNAAFKTEQVRRRASALGILLDI